MSIVQTAETIAAYDIKITELSKGVNQARAYLAVHGLVLVWLTLLVGVCGLLSLMGLLMGMTASNDKQAGVITFLIFFPLGTLFLWRWKIRAAANAEAKRVLGLMIVEYDAMKSRKDAIVNGVVAVTNKSVEAVRQAANTIEAPVNATMGEKTCPMCAETIKSAAKKCKHCGHLFEQQT